MQKNADGVALGTAHSVRRRVVKTLTEFSRRCKTVLIINDSNKRCVANAHGGCLKTRASWPCSLMPTSTALGVSNETSNTVPIVPTHDLVKVLVQKKLNDNFN